MGGKATTAQRAATRKKTSPRATKKKASQRRPRIKTTAEIEKEKAPQIALVEVDLTQASGGDFESDSATAGAITLLAQAVREQTQMIAHLVQHVDMISQRQEELEELLLAKRTGSPSFEDWYEKHKHNGVRREQERYLMRQTAPDDEN
jgi:hypothetical protein